MTTFLVFRVVHILLAAIWVGFTAATTFYFVPAIKDARAAGSQVMAGVMKRGFSTMLSSIAGIVMLTGIYLYQRVTNNFDPVVSGSMMGRVFGIGGAAGIVATILGSMVGARARKLTKIMAQAWPMPRLLAPVDTPDGKRALTRWSVD